ncbi:hypothetical protein MTAT_09920 [Moorella thermoacetica]|uniref:Carbamoyl phosphate synthase-like protein n=1 Tax=Neomoorella thermoacetica TaxID=1525 RepID=A0AAC9HH06_NEOTH|nr:ATP-grasp domain-containing protein [Moorella thermoacetica]AOQ23411.1 carbamoyl phosphate synthase-like protein [Moorella thermoacetica]TYL13596.1 hypothetical protein MTAT_09920 [Moorella thermoacetica]
MNVLITSASRKVSLVRAFQEALTQHGGGIVIPVDASPYSAALYESPVRFLVPRSDDPSFISTVLNICEKHEVKLVVPTRDEELPVFAHNKQLFEKNGIKVMVGSSWTIETCQDKKLFLQFCRREGFAVPKEYLPEKVKKVPSLLPVFIKERRGKGSRRVFKVNTLGQLNELMERLKEPIVQEYVEAPEYTVDLFSDFDGQVISVVPRQRLQIFGGESFVGKTFYHRVIIDECCRMAQKLSLIGHNTIQCFFDGTRVQFIEVNPRYGGGANLGFAAGAHTPTYLVRLVNGLPVPPRIGQFERDLVMLRYTQDSFLYEKDLKKLDIYPGA